jgi:hypothetical protein
LSQVTLSTPAAPLLYGTDQCFPCGGSPAGQTGSERHLFAMHQGKKSDGTRSRGCRRSFTPEVVFPQRGA